MYHALTGQAPPSATLRISAPEEFAPLRSLNGRISSPTAAVIERAMELQRSKRWLTASEMARALGYELRGTGAEYVQPSEPPARGRGDRRHAAASPAMIGVRGGPGTSALPRASVAAARDERRFSIPFLMIGVLALLLFGGGGTAAVLHMTGVISLNTLFQGAQPTATLTPEPTTVLATATPTPSATLTATPTVTSTPLPTPTVTRTPRPSSTPLGAVAVTTAPPGDVAIEPHSGNPGAHSDPGSDPNTRQRAASDDRRPGGGHWGAGGLRAVGKLASRGSTLWGIGPEHGAGQGWRAFGQIDVSVPGRGR